jgi:hypothetical protein
MTLNIYKSLRTVSPKTGRIILILIKVSLDRFRHR